MEFWKDQAAPTAGFPTAAVAFGMAAPGVASTNDMVFSSWNGIYWAERMRMTNSGNLGIGTINPTSRLEVGGIVASSAGGYKFPDGSVQTSAAGKIFTKQTPFLETELGYGQATTDLVELHVPPGAYMVTGTVDFENRANGLFQDNTRLIKCSILGEFIWEARLGGAGNPMDHMPITLHSVINASANDNVLKLSCSTMGLPAPHSFVFAIARRLTAVRLESVVAQF